MQKIVHFLSFSTVSHEFTPFFNTFRAQSNKFQTNDTHSFRYCNIFHVHLIIYNIETPNYIYHIETPKQRYWAQSK